MGQEMEAAFGQPFDLLLGRRTYDIFAAHWPFQQDDIGKAFNACTKYVATRSGGDFSWVNTKPLRGDAVAQVTALKEGDGPDLLIQGSSELTHALAAAGLIDLFQVWTFPVLLGDGKRLFSVDQKPQALTLQRSVTSSTGVVMTRWTPAGEVGTGSFAHDTPSDAEVERRQAMADGRW